MNHVLLFNSVGSLSIIIILITIIDDDADDHSSLDFKSAVQYMKHFMYHFTQFLLVLLFVNLLSFSIMPENNDNTMVQYIGQKYWKNLMHKYVPFVG